MRGRFRVGEEGRGEEIMFTERGKKPTIYKKEKVPHYIRPLDLDKSIKILILYINI